MRPILQSQGLIIFAACLACGPLSAEQPATPESPTTTAPAFDRGDWSDLRREPLYGSEKEEKYRVNAVIVEEEVWRDHYCLSVFGLFRYTDYPAFRSLNVLPFYSSLASKNDPRRSSWLFPAYYASFDGLHHLQVTPLSLRHFTPGGDGFGLYGFLYLASREKNESVHALLPLISLRQNPDQELTSLAVAPLFYARSGRDDFTLITPGVYYDSDSDSTTTASPLHYYHRRSVENNETTTILAPGFFRHANVAEDTPASLQTLVGPLWHSDDGRGGTAWHLFPLYASWRQDTHESKLAASQHLTALGYFSQSAAHSRHITPFYFYSSNQPTPNPGKPGSRETAASSIFFAPILPLYYASSDAESGAVRWFANLRYSNNREGDFQSLWIAPLLFYGGGENGYLYAPPFYFHASSGSTNDPVADHESVSFGLLHYYSRRQNNNAETYRTTLWLPLFLPIHYRSDGARSGSARQYGPVYYEHNSDDALEYLMAAPLVFYKPDKYFIAAPLYFQAENGRGESSRHLLPLFASWKQVNQDGQPSSQLMTPLAFLSSSPASSLHISPFYVYSASRSAAQVPTENVKNAFTFFAPLLPLYYASDDPESGDIRWYGNLRTKTDVAGNFESLWVAPLFFYKPGSNGYMYTIPFYFRSRWNEDGDETRTFGILHYSHTKKDAERESAFYLTPLGHYSREYIREGNQSSTLHINPLYYYSDRVQRDGTKVDYRTTLWFPSPLPLHYRSDDAERGSARLYGPVYYSHDRDGELEKIYAAPLVFYEPDRFLYAIPVYFQTRNDENEYQSFSPLHYAHVENRNTASEKGVIWAGPYYRSYNENTNRRFAHFAPLYFSWDTPESEFQLSLPLFLSYKSDRRLIHINAAGISLSEERIPLPRVGINAKNEWYLEQDIALFYNLFRLSTRVTLSEREESKESPVIFSEPDFAHASKENSAPIQDDEPDNRDRGVSRDNARNYWGAQSLYGMVAYERADTRRHFRILPLTWLTWDAATENRVYLVPGGFLSYENEVEDQEYLAIFPGFLPLYGYQREGASFIEAYLGLGYIREYDAETETREHSALWPIANFHSSPRSSGGRVLPLFWQQTERDDTGEETSTTLSPLYFAKARDSAIRRTALRISPLFFYSSTAYVATHEGDRAAYQSILILPAPGLYIQDSDHDTTYNWLAFAGLHYAKVSSEAKVDRLAPHGDRDYLIADDIHVDVDVERSLAAAYLAPFFFYQRNSHLHLAPLYFSTRDEAGKNVAHFGPGYYYSRQDKTSESTLVLPGFYRGTDAATSHTNVLLLADWESRNTGGLNHAWLFPIIGYSPQNSPNEGSYAFVAPIYYNYAIENKRDTETYHVSPLFYYSSRAATQQSTAHETQISTLILPAPGLYFHKSESTSTYSWLGLAGLHFEQNNLSDLWTAPVLFYQQNAYLHLAPLYFSTRDEAGKNVAHFGPGYYYSQTGRDESLLVLPGLYQKRDDSQTHTNILLMANWSVDENRDLASAWIFPIFAHGSNQGDESRDKYTYAFPFYNGYDAGSRETVFHILPLLFSWYKPDIHINGAGGDLALFAGGLYIRRAPDYQRDNLLYLFDRKVEGFAENTNDSDSDKTNIHHSYALLFQSVSYEGEKNASRFDMGYGYIASLAHRQFEDPGRDGEFAGNLLWLTHESRRDYTHNSFFPIWWYSHGPEESVWAFAPLLSGGLRDKTETTNLIGAGALYYEFADTVKRESSRALLLGALYSDVRRNERGYRSRGSLWSYLWEYQEESESDYRKFSVLKFIYSNTRHSGRTRTRILGIRVHES